MDHAPSLTFPLDQLRTYTSTATPPGDFEEFWDRTIADARALPLDAVFEPVDNYLSVINTFDVTFSGFGGGDRIKGWLHVPAQLEPGEQLPVVVEYIGYSGGRGLVNQNTRWAQAGYVHFIMDTRGQGYGGVAGDTPDPHPSAGGINYAGLMTRGGADHQDNYYFRRVYVDAFRAVEAAQNHPAVDPSKVVLTGVSRVAASLLLLPG